MIRDDQGNPIIAMNLSPQLPNGKFCIQQRLRGEGAQRYEHLWPNQFDLTYQVRAARRNLFGARVSVSGWPMFEDVDDEHVFARELDGGQNLFEELSRLTNEWSARFVLGRAGRLTDEHEIRLRTPLAWHRILGRRIQRTARAGRDRARDGVERVETRSARAEEIARRRTDDNTRRRELSADLRCRRGNSALGARYLCFRLRSSAGGAQRGAPVVGRTNGFWLPNGSRFICWCWRCAWRHACGTDYPKCFLDTQTVEHQLSFAELSTLLEVSTQLLSRIGHVTASPRGRGFRRRPGPS